LSVVGFLVFTVVSWLTVRLELVMPLGWGTTVHENGVALATRARIRFGASNPRWNLSLAA
jgi:hypothetical protein